MAKVLEDVRKDAILSVLGLLPVESLKDVETAYQEWQRLQSIQSVLDEYYKTLRSKLFDYAEKIGQPDEKGSFTVHFEDGSGFRKERRVSMKVNKERAIELAQRKGLVELLRMQVVSRTLRARRALETLVAKYAEEVETELDIDEEGLATAYAEGRLDDAELESCMDRKETWALVLLDKRRR